MPQSDGQVDIVLEEASSSPEGAPRSRLREWIINHDDSWLFIGAYVTLAVVLSIVISLFWLLVVVGIHILFEWIRQRHTDRWTPGVVVRVLWEVKLDIALVMFALALAVYMDVVLGAAGLGAAARTGTMSAARFAGWERAIRGVLISVDDMAHVARAAGGKRKNGSDTEDSPDAAETFSMWGGWTQRWAVGDHIGFWLLVVSLLCIAAAPALIGQTPQEVWLTLLEELRPLPGGE
ncbi:MAG: hypothetical protein EA376_07895 [Phycisphaeraceae bacterium]|nr:MAG: hypothetical protein EA376_07895 [Phycisphaeraceae bacterium]